MNVEQLNALGFKFSIEDGGNEVARTRLYILKNDLHKEPFGFIEDVWVHPDHRGQGIAGRLVEAARKKAAEYNCYKIILTTRFKKRKVCAWYGRLGFKTHGFELREDLQ